MTNNTKKQLAHNKIRISSICNWKETLIKVSSWSILTTSRQRPALSAIFRPGTGLISLLSLFAFLLGWPLQKAQGFTIWNQTRMKFGTIVMQANTIDGDRFSIWCHTFKMAAVTLFYAEKCCHLVIAHAASVWRICSSVRQFLIRKFTVIYLYFLFNWPILLQSWRLPDWTLDDDERMYFNVA